MDPLQNNFEFNYSQSSTNMEQSDYDCFFSTCSNASTSCNYEQQRSMPIFTNGETRSLSYMPQPYTNQNISSPNTIADYSQVHDSNNSRPEIPIGFNDYLQPSINMTQVEHPDYFTNNVSSETYARPQQSQQSELPFTNEMQQYTDQNISSSNTMMHADFPQAYNPCTLRFEIKITITPISPFANLNN